MAKDEGGTRQKADDAKYINNNCGVEKSCDLVDDKHINNFSVEVNYDLGEDIGDGQCAIVKRAEHRETGKVVAVKLIDKGDTGMQLTDKEIAVMLRIEHDSCVKLHEVYDTAQHCSLVLELMQGSDLFERILTLGKYNEAEAKVLLRRIAEGTQHLHSKNIIHRDLKPENILLVSPDNNSNCKVADFGLSRLFPEGSGRQVKTGTLCGTPGYVAPEVLNRQPYSYGIDVWSLGVIAYITLCGFPPFPLDMQKDSVRKVKTADFTFMSPYWDGISPEAKDFIQKMIVVEPELRATMEEVLAHPFLN